MTPTREQAMDDRTLLERAAKAAGLQLDYTIRPDGKAFYHSDRNALALADGGWFAPLNDDGDEARLEAAMGLDVVWASDHVMVGDYECESYSSHNGDKQKARRRAGVRAAAEIGGE